MSTREKAKPVVRRGRKATGLMEEAGSAKNGGSGFFSGPSHFANLKHSKSLMMKSGYIIIGILLMSLASIAHAEIVNLALSGSATQSSTTTWDSSGPAVASRAIDGNTNGDFFDHSVSCTDIERAWWLVDLKNMYHLNQIVVWNRTDTWMFFDCASRLSNFYVAVLNDKGTEVWKQNYYTDGGYPSPSLIINLPNNILGQVVRVGLNSDNYLHLAEVQVYGQPPPKVPIIPQKVPETTDRTKIPDRKRIDEVLRESTTDETTSPDRPAPQRKSVDKRRPRKPEGGSPPPPALPAGGAVSGY